MLNTGAYTVAVQIAGEAVAPAIADDTATTYAVTQDGTGVATAHAGVALLDLTYVDNDAANNTIVVKAYESSTSSDCGFSGRYLSRHNL